MIQHKYFRSPCRSKLIRHDVAFISYQRERRRLPLQILPDIVDRVVRIAVDTDQPHTAITQLIRHLRESQRVQLHQRAFGAKKAHDCHTTRSGSDLNGFAIQCL